MIDWLKVWHWAKWCAGSWKLMQRTEHTTNFTLWQANVINAHDNPAKTRGKAHRFFFPLSHKVSTRESAFGNEHFVMSYRALIPSQVIDAAIDCLTPAPQQIQQDWKHVAAVIWNPVVFLERNWGLNKKCFWIISHTRLLHYSLQWKMKIWNGYKTGPVKLLWLNCCFVSCMSL